MKRIITSLLLMTAVWCSSQTITVLSPIANDTAIACNPKLIQWTATGGSIQFNIDYSINGGISWVTIVSSFIGNNYAWSTPDFDVSNCIIRVRDVLNSSTEGFSAAFSILPVLHISIPPPVNTGDSATIYWQTLANSAGNQDTISFYYSFDNGLSWTYITSQFGTAGNLYNFNWYVPGNSPSNALLRGTNTMAGGCLHDTVPFTINPVFYAAAGPDTGGCEGSTFQIGGNPSAGNGNLPVTYLWLGPNGFSSTVANPTFTNATTALTGTYTLIVTDSNADSDTDYVNVTVTPGVVPAVSINTSSTTICSGTSATFTATSTNGGTTPIYQWKLNGINVGTNSAIFTTSALTNGDVITCTLTSNALCASPSTATSNAISVTLLPSPIANAGADQIICMGSSVVIGGTPPATGIGPFTYSWSPGNGLSSAVVASPTASPALSMSYLFTVVDANGCVGTDFVVVTVDSFQISNVVTTDVLCYGGSDGSASVNTVGGACSISYQWFFGTGNSTATNLAVGTYTVTAIDCNGCLDDETFNILQPTALTLSVASTNGNQIPDSVVATVNGGVAPYLFNWGDGATGGANSHWYVVAGMYFIDVTDANGCTIMDSITLNNCTVNCVWPGDADNDFIADNNDLLGIGLAYGNSGPARADQDILWYAHGASAWGDTLPNGQNQKHSDCDGSGLINADDTTAILSNFGLTHSKTDAQQPWRGGAPTLTIDLVPDSAIDGEAVVANLLLGDATNPANDVYGLAFTFNYDMLPVDTTQTTVNFGNSWLGDATDKISIAKDFGGVGQIKCAITRIDHSNRSGNGSIGSVNFVITTDNINGKDYWNFRAWITNLVVIDNMGNVLAVNEGTDSTAVEYEPNTITETNLAQIRLYPMPVRDELWVITGNEASMESDLTNALGEVVWQSRLSGSRQYRISTRSLAAGMYYLQLKTNSGSTVRKVQVVD